MTDAAFETYSPAWAAGEEGERPTFGAADEGCERGVPVPPALAAVEAQPAAVSLLAQALAADRVTHAYLFVGAPGALIAETARGFAAALLCPEVGCNTCAACGRVQRGTHPDCVELAPLGAREYLVEQMRDLVLQTQYAPVQAKRKVFILDRADQMNQASANAFLKTLEEPPAGVVFILIASRETSVLPTVLSRCQVVRFRTIPADQAAVLVQRRTGVDPVRAALAVAACEGSVTAAVAFAQDPASWTFRGEVLGALAKLGDTDPWGAICAGRSFGVHWMSPVEAVKARQEADRVKEEEFLDKQALKAADARNKRELTAATAAGFGRITALTRSWLRDVLVVREGLPDLVANTDALADITRAAGRVSEAGIRAATEATQRAERRIAYNVQAQHVIDALMIELRKALYE